jgi:nucleoid-associated protein YgaU
VRRNGNVCRLTWESFQYTVVISEFKADFNKRFWIQYSMSCQVVEDEVDAIPVPATPSPNDALKQDSATATQLSLQVNLQDIVAAVQAVGTAIVNVTNAAQPIANGLVSLNAPQIGPQVGPSSTLSVATNTAIQAARAPLAALQNAVQGAIASCEQGVEALPSLGYIDPTQSMSGQVNALVAQCNAAAQLPSLYELNALTFRMEDNLDLVADPAGNNQIVTGGGNLYQLAAQEYGDATRWTDIADASGINDPMMTGFNTVTVPQ